MRAQVARVRHLHRVGNAAVQAQPPALAQPVVERAARDRVRERKPVRAGLDDQTRGDAVFQRGDQRVDIDIDEGFEHVDVELGADDRGECEHVLDVIGEPTETA
jgi:hypothetical protein